MTKIHKRKIGLALGGGSARGWSHIGVIRALQEAGVEPDIVCGTSIGSLVGAAYAAGELDRLEAWVKSLTWQNVVSLLDVTVTGGFIKGAKLVDFFASRFTDVDITKLPKPFGAVATDLLTGREVWLREGSVIESVRASIAVPGLFTPVARDGRLLADGGLVTFIIARSPHLATASLPQARRSEGHQAPQARRSGGVYFRQTAGKPRGHQERPEILEFHALCTGRADE